MEMKMKNNINEFIKNNLKVKNLAESKDPLRRHLSVRMLISSRLPQIICTDGFSMSVQVGYSLYSTPKKVAKRYSAVEIGYPSEREPLIDEYIENLLESAPNYTDSVYPYVPVKVVNQILKKHGGINLTETFRQAESEWKHWSEYLPAHEFNSKVLHGN
tara:strand:- start:740 stop:1216 length:477 start_codon:yes stop_codon:yes gene_type:complete